MKLKDFITVFVKGNKTRTSCGTYSVRRGDHCAILTASVRVNNRPGGAMLVALKFDDGPIFVSNNIPRRLSITHKEIWSAVLLNTAIVNTDVLGTNNMDLLESGLLDKDLDELGNVRYLLEVGNVPYLVDNVTRSGACSKNINRLQKLSTRVTSINAALLLTKPPTDTCKEIGKFWFTAAETGTDPIDLISTDMLNRLSNYPNPFTYGITVCDVEPIAPAWGQQDIFSLGSLNCDLTTNPRAADYLRAVEGWNEACKKLLEIFPRDWNDLRPQLNQPSYKTIVVDKDSTPYIRGELVFGKWPGTTTYSLDTWHKLVKETGITYLDE